MSDVVISVENVSKCYRLGSIGTRTLSGDFERWWARARGKPDPFLKVGQQDHGNRQGEALWALRDVNFQVHQGEVLGVIGRNGAGKSTLLKILSRITAPTSGLVKVKGRVASLLEVGTGFHPELTGRENIYMNGAILGMSKAEIAKKFDEIVDFSGVEQFIDTPVKRYSSGMYVRLAFAVAAHLEPEILMVDEVLAVGDAEFQSKCLGKMGEVARAGRTVLFVSHNMDAVARLCTTAMLVQQGLVVNRGNANDVVRSYLTQASTDKTKNTLIIVQKYQQIDQYGIILEKIWLNANEQSTEIVKMGEPLQILLSLKKVGKPRKIRFGVIVEDGLTGQRLFTVTPAQQFDSLLEFTSTNILVLCNIKQLPLIPGPYSITVAISGEIDTVYMEQILSFTVIAHNGIEPGYSHSRSKGIIYVDASWHLKETSANE